MTKNIRVKGARELIAKLMDLIDQFANSPVKTLAQTLKSWLELIVRIWRFSKSNGITEGFHTKFDDNYLGRLTTTRKLLRCMDPVLCLERRHPCKLPHVVRHQH